MKIEAKNSPGRQEVQEPAPGGVFFLSGVPFPCRCLFYGGFAARTPDFILCISPEISNRKSRLTHQPTFQERMRHSSPLLDGKLSSGAHLICQAGFLAYGSDARSPLLTCIRVMQWDIESGLSEYSDRIVQDSHLIPSSRLTARTWHSIFCTISL